MYDRSTTTAFSGSPRSRCSFSALYQHAGSVRTQYWTSGLVAIANDSFAQSIGLEPCQVAGARQ